jgi:L-threonylcarbamoyladenylate synthase
MTEVVRVDPVRPEPDAIARAVQCLARGGLVAFPTETVYGLGAHALDPVAVRRIFAAKDRPANDPLIVHIANLDQARPLVATIPDAARTLADRFWPGPLTIVMPRSAAVPAEVTAGLDTVALRVPAHPVARALLEAACLPIAAPSANLFSRPSPTRASHVLADLDGRIDLVLDAGATDVGVESTVLDLTSSPPTILRPGAVTIEMLREILPDVRLRTNGSSPDAPLPSPGLLPQHYAPRAPLMLFEGHRSDAVSALVSEARTALAAGQRIGVLATSEEVPKLAGLGVVIAELGSEQEPEHIAARLYAALRDLDAAKVDRILSVAFSDDRGLWVALRDRLRRAATQVVQID